MLRFISEFLFPLDMNFSCHMVHGLLKFDFRLEIIVHVQIFESEELSTNDPVGFDGCIPIPAKVQQ